MIGEPHVQLPEGQHAGTEEPKELPPQNTHRDVRTTGATRGNRAGRSLELPDCTLPLSAGQTPGSGHRCSPAGQRRSAQPARGDHRTPYKTRRPRRQPGRSRYRRCSSCGDRNDVCFLRIGHTASRTRALPTVVEDAGPRLPGLPSGRRLLRGPRVGSRNARLETRMWCPTNVWGRRPREGALTWNDARIDGAVHLRRPGPRAATPWEG